MSFAVGDGRFVKGTLQPILADHTAVDKWDFRNFVNEEQVLQLRIGSDFFCIEEIRIEKDWTLRIRAGTQSTNPCSF